MQPECVEIAIMRGDAPRCLINAAILADPCMRTESARTATLVTIIN